MSNNWVIKIASISNKQESIKFYSFKACKASLSRALGFQVYLINQTTSVEIDIMFSINKHKKEKIENISGLLYVKSMQIPIFLCHATPNEFYYQKCFKLFIR